MFDDCQSNVVSGPTRGLPSLAWPAEPPLVEMLGDPMFRQLMASDRVSMESFTNLVSSVRQRLAS